MKLELNVVWQDGGLSSQQCQTLVRSTSPLIRTFVRENGV